MVNEFPIWIGITHFFNLLFITLLMRSGIQILCDHPRLYWNDHSAPDSEWIRFTRKKVPTDRYYTSKEDSIPAPQGLALPGGLQRLGMGRHWHFMTATLWMLNGLIYIILLFATDRWTRLIPTSWDFFPALWQAFVDYLHLHKPEPYAGHPYNALQQLAYAFIIFICAPLMMLTGIAMSPAVIGRFPWYGKIFGGRQGARSIHFIVFVTFVLFLIVHIILVAVEDFPTNMLHISLGKMEGNRDFAIIWSMSGLTLVIILHIIATFWSKRHPRQVQNTLGKAVQKLTQFFLGSLTSHQHYTKSDISPHHWTNGFLPKTKEWLDLAKDNFKHYRLEVKGLVENPCLLSLDDLKRLKFTSEIIKHNCIQGWTSIAEWGGVPVSEIIKLVRPCPEAKYIVFHSYQMNKIPENPAAPEVEYYSSLSLQEAGYPQTILAYEMNGDRLKLDYGAPLRLRMETKLGYKMTKWIKAIEFVDDYKKIGLGYGGYREDQEYYDGSAYI